MRIRAEAGGRGSLYNWWAPARALLGAGVGMGRSGREGLRAFGAIRAFGAVCSVSVSVCVCGCGERAEGGSGSKEIAYGRVAGCAVISRSSVRLTGGGSR